MWMQLLKALREEWFLLQIRKSKCLYYDSNYKKKLVQDLFDCYRSYNEQYFAYWESECNWRCYIVSWEAVCESISCVVCLFDARHVQIHNKISSPLFPVLDALTIDELMSARNASEKNEDLLIDSFISQSHHVEERELERWPLMEMNQTILNWRLYGGRKWSIEGSTFGLYEAQYWYEVLDWYGD